MFHQETRLYLHQMRLNLHKQKKRNNDKTLYREKCILKSLLKSQTMRKLDIKEYY